HFAQPHEVFHSSSCITAGIDLSALATMRRRTSSWPRSVQGQMGCTAAGLYASPSVAASSFSTSPVHEPHEADALVWPLTSSRVVSRLLMIALVIVDLQTPLQPQISASSGKAATAAKGSESPPP